MQGGVERAVLDEDLVAGDLLDPPRDAVAVQRLAAHRFQDEDPKRPLQQIYRRPVHTREHTPRNMSMSNGSIPLASAFRRNLLRAAPRRRSPELVLFRRLAVQQVFYEKVPAPPRHVVRRVAEAV